MGELRLGGSQGRGVGDEMDFDEAGFFGGGGEVDFGVVGRDEFGEAFAPFD